jgi:hypothetical protein
MNELPGPPSKESPRENLNGLMTVLAYTTGGPRRVP